MSLRKEVEKKWNKLNMLDTIRLEITEKCNFRCVHCYSGNRCQKEFKHSQLSMKSLINVVQEAKKLGAYKVVLTGGEPFLYPDLLKLCKKIRDLNFMLVIYTNGSLIDEYKAKALSEIGVSMLLVSNYGTKKKYFEKTTGLSGSRKQYEKGIASLEKHDISYKLQTVLLSTNEKDRNNLWEICKPRVDCRITVGKHGSFHPAKYRASDQAIKDILKYKFLHQKNQENEFTVTKDMDQSDPVCNMGQAKLVIDIEGKVLPCSNAQPIGDIKKESLQEIWEGEELKQVKNEITWKNYDLCQQCSYKKYRYNICPVLNYLETEDRTKPPEEQCRLCRLRYEVISEYRGEKVGIQ